MAKVKELTVGTSRKIGLPGYSSVDVSAFITIKLSDDDIVAEVYNKAWVTVEKQVLKQIKDKGLNSPVAAEVEYDGPEAEEWLNKESPNEQAVKIEANKRMQQVVS